MVFVDAKFAIVRDNESSAKLWQLYWSDDVGRSVIALAGLTRQLNHTVFLLEISAMRGKVLQWDLDFSVGVPNRTLAEKYSEGPNIGSNFGRMDLGHARGCIFQDCTMAPSIR